MNTIGHRKLPRFRRRVTFRRFHLAVSRLAVAIVLGYVVYPWWCRRSATLSEASGDLPGDALVRESTSGYTLAVAIAAPPEEVWPWLLQMGQGRGGFYTHEWVENFLGADIHNANRIVPALQRLALGDRVRLTPDPFLGSPGQFMTVAIIEPSVALVFRQDLPSGGLGTWAFVLQATANESTRLIFRRRASQPSWFDRVMAPGYQFMDRGMLAGIKKRAEANR